MATFKDLPLSQSMLSLLEKLGFTEPTEIQAKAIPILMATKSIDFHGQAQTGTGKTLAFGIPLLEQLDPTITGPQALILAPTRELAVQLYESLKGFADALDKTMTVVYGGVPIDEQIRKLRKGVQVIVGTPGRVNDHLRRKTLNADSIQTLILDEADIMLDMGFKEEINEIIRHLPKKRQIWLFSATVKAGIKDIIKKHMIETVSVRITPSDVTTSQTKQWYCIVPYRARIHAITRFIQSVPDFYGFIFCQTKILASDVAESLIKRGYNVAALHGDMSQTQRNRVIKRFRQGEVTILVATDVAARGIDIPDITHVINYTIPDDPESYVHRIGRTGRAGKAGVAITFISKTEQRSIKHIERKFGTKIDPIDVPSADVVIHERLKSVPEFIQKQLTRKVPQGPELKKLVAQLSLPELQNLAGALLYELFLSNLDLDEIPFTHVEDENQFQEISLDKGQDDGITQDDIRNFLLQTGVIKAETIKKIRIIKRKSFVKLSSDCSPDLVTSLRGRRLHGHKVRVTVTCMVNGTGRPQRPRKRRKK